MLESYVVIGSIGGKDIVAMRTGIYWTENGVDMNTCDAAAMIEFGWGALAMFAIGMTESLIDHCGWGILITIGEIGVGSVDAVPDFMACLASYYHD